MEKKIEIRKVAVSELTPMPLNPRTITERALAGLRSSIDRFGLVQPVVWNRRTGHVVGGHQRLRVLREKGVERTEVVVVDLPETEEKALNITLNNQEITGAFTEEIGEMIESIQTELEDAVADLEIGALSESLQVPIKGTVDLEEFEIVGSGRPVWIMIATDEACAALIESLLRQNLTNCNYRLERSDLPG